MPADKPTSQPVLSWWSSKRQYLVFWQEILVGDNPQGLILTLVLEELSERQWHKGFAVGLLQKTCRWDPACQEPQLCCFPDAVAFLPSLLCLVGTGSRSDGVQQIALTSQRDADRYSPTVPSFIPHLQKQCASISGCLQFWVDSTVKQELAIPEQPMECDTELPQKLMATSW